MKILITLLLILSFEVQALTRHEEIDLMKVNENIGRLMKRLNFIAVEHYTILRRVNPEDTRSRYKRIVMVEPNLKPKLTLLRSELVLFKAELHIIEDARLAEAARKKDIRKRLKALKRKRSSMEINLNISNPAAWLRDNIVQMDHSTMEAHIVAIEAEDIIQTQLAEAEEKKEKDWKAARAFIKNYDCSTLGNAYTRNLCRFQQGR
jgi:hypothetical protein